MDNTTAQTIAGAAHCSLYRQESSHPRINAQSNLSGRTHYCDSDTLRYHYARILSGREMFSGAFFRIAESVALDSNNTTRGTRCVMFDLFGTPVYRPSLENCRRTRDQAERDFDKWLAHFDPVKYYQEILSDRADRLCGDAAVLKAVAADLTSAEVQS